MDVPQLKPRAEKSHKGDYGRALIIAGSVGMTGAACLTGYATVRSGAGLVSVAVPDCCLELVANYHPCYMTIPIPNDTSGKFSVTKRQLDQVLTRCLSATSVGLGPGIGQSEAISDLVLAVYSLVECPVVVDADALNALSGSPWSLKDPGGPRILTPHIGEFRRLIAEPDLSPDEFRERAKEVAAEFGIIIVLKDHQTLVTDGTQHYVNTTGNPGMATGGSGDVLTGVITALLGQGYTPMEAAVLGTHVHGLAGDIAVESVGHEISISAEDVANSLGQAFRKLAGASKSP